jgi:hypothetical protein
MRRSPAPPGNVWRALAAPIAAFAVAGLLKAAGIAVPILGSGWARLDLAISPADLTEPLQRAELELPEGAGVLNHFDYGGFIVYAARKLRVLVDDRYELHGAAFMAQVTNAVLRNGAAAEAYADTYDLRLALLPLGSASEVRFAASPRWRLLGRGRTAALYERR